MVREDEILKKTLDVVQELPQRAAATYARLWQLETWLRQMVYIEIRAAFGNKWREQVEGQPCRSLTADLQLTHMPTPERSPISYATFGSLQRTIDRNWNLFATYFPPQDLWVAKLKEVSQIRNRAAHFRLGHSDDLERVIRFMRDIDQGFWSFCTSYNEPSPVLPSSKDPVVKKFQHLNLLTYAKIDTKKWAMVGTANPQATFNIAINILQRPWLRNRLRGRVSGQAGLLYDVVIVGRDSRSFDYSRFLHDTEAIHDDLVHVCLDSSNAGIRVTIPAILGTRTVNKAIEAILHWVPNSLHRSLDTKDRSDQIQRLAEEWPEYVLGPKNPLCFLSPEMPCSFFTV